MGNGSSDQAVSLPRGGGALKGLGENFTPDLHTGTGNFNVPIALPPGRSDFQPALSLVYSTGNGNGPFGLGWNRGWTAPSAATGRSACATSSPTSGTTCTTQIRPLGP